MGNILSSFAGEVHLHLSSSTPERFFNICNANGIVIDQICKEKEDYCFKTSVSDYFRLKPIVKKTNSHLDIVEKRGMRFWIFAHRKQYCFTAGVLLAVMLLYLLTLHLWDIAVEGNLMVSDDVVRDLLLQNNITTGMYIKNIDCSRVEKILRDGFDELTWVSVELTGTRMIIHVKENDEDYVISNEQSLGDICASKDGIVYSIITRKGTPMVKAGDAVKKGDILVKCTISVLDDYGVEIACENVIPDADILLITDNSYEDVLQKEYSYKIYTGKQKKTHFVRWGNYSVILGFLPTYDQREMLLEDQQLHLQSSLYLPVHYGGMTYCEYKEENALYSEEDALKILERNYNYYIEGLKEKGVQILEKDVKIKDEIDSFCYVGTIKLIEDATIRKVCPMEEIGEIHEYY